MWTGNTNKTKVRKMKSVMLEKERDERRGVRGMWKEEKDKETGGWQVKLKDNRKRHATRDKTRTDKQRKQT